MKKLIVALALIVSFLGAKEMNIYDIEVQTIEGKTVTLDTYKNKVMLIVNVASKCGYTYQYEGLEKLHELYANKGLAVLGFPCNQFLSQEPGTEKEIQSFCSLTYGVKFDMFSKIDVNGADTHPLYDFLKNHSAGFMGTDIIKWNFTKFLVNRDGKVIERYSPSTKPKEIEADILKLL